MHEGGFGFDLTRRVVRAIPDCLRGKTRLARAALRTFLRGEASAIPDRYGNSLRVPSLDEPISVALFAFGIYEPDTVAAILRHLSPRGVFVDVGANVGALSLPVAACRPDAQIISIEADPEIASLLRQNVIENKRSNNISVVNSLAGAIDKPHVPFYCAPSAKFGMGSIGPQFRTEPMLLAQRRLDAILDELAIEQVDVVKLDIEGAEFGALQGLSRRLKSRGPPAIVFEFADWAETRINGQAAGSAQEFLLSLGYRLFRLARAGRAGEQLEHPVTTGSTMILALPCS